MSGEPPKVDFCIHCGEYLRPGVTFCPKCGNTLATGPQAQGHMPSVTKSKRPTYAGVLLFLVGIVGFLMVTYLLTNTEEIMEQARQIYGGELQGMEEAVDLLAGFWAFAGVMAMVGGACALRRSHFPIALVGAVLGLLTGGFFLEGTIMAVLALFLLLTSKQEFR